MFITENTMAGLNGNYTVEAAEGYSGGIGCQFAALEAAQTDFSFLTAFVQSDAREIGMVREGAGEEEVHTMLEGAIADAWNKLKEWVKKIWEKIKGIFKAFIARLEDFMGKNGYAYFEKYKKVLYDGTPLKDLKSKYRKVNDQQLNDLLADRNVAKVFPNFGAGAKATWVSKKIEDIDSEDLVDEFLTTMLGGTSTSKKSFKTDFFDKCFDTESTEDLEQGKIAEYVKYISDKKSIIEKFEKQRDTIDKGFNQISKALDKLADEGVKQVSGGAASSADVVDVKTGTVIGFGGVGGKTGVNKQANDAKTSQDNISKARIAVNCLQSALTTYNSTAMEAGKFAIAQSRRLAAVIVAYKMRHKNEAFADVEMSDELYTIIGEAAEYEALDAMDDLATA